MKKEQLHINLNSLSKGFSLVELLISFSILLLFISAISNTTVGVNRQIFHASNIERASILAREAIEVCRNIRDDNFDNLMEGTYGLATSSGKWILSSSPDTRGIFQRQITISDINLYQKKIDVNVSWPDSVSSNNSVPLNTYLTHWNKITPDSGIMVTKTVINHGGSKTSSDFAPFKVGTTTVVLSTSTSFPPGSYTVSEVSDSNYTTIFSGDCDSSGLVSLNYGDAKTCSIVNEEKPSKIIINKTVINHGQTKTASDFLFFVDTVPVVHGDLNTFDSGLHIVSESANSDYVSSISGDCNSSGEVSLIPDQTKTCNILNEEKLSYLTVNKNVINKSGSKTSSDFAPFKVGTTTVVLGSPTVFNSGTYSVTETNSSGYTATFGGDCNTSGLVILTSGSNKICLITNTENIGNWANPNTLAGSLNLSGSNDGEKIKYQGNYVYIVRNDGTPDFAIVDISNSSLPVLKGSLSLSGAPTNIFVSGDYAFVSTDYSLGELQIINISNPLVPTLTGVFNAPGNFAGNDVFVVGNTAYLVRKNGGSFGDFIVVDVSNLASPTLVGSLNTGGNGFEVFVSGNYAFVASSDDAQELKVISLINPLSPTVIGSYNIANKTDAITIDGFGSTILLGQGSSLYSIDVSIPSVPTLLGTYSAGGTVNDISLGNNNTYAFIATSNGSDEIQVVNISNLTNLALVGGYNAATTPNGLVYDENKDKLYVVGPTDTTELYIIIP